MRLPTPQMRLNPLVVYTSALIVVLLWPFFLPGFLGLRDMVILDHPALTEYAFGLGDTPARNAPQDGFLALIGTVLPAGWVARALILGSAALGAYLSTLWVTTADNHLWRKAAAITLTLWNPFVIERLLQGHWSLVIAAWLLPGIAVVHRTSSKAALVALCSLTPTGLILGLITALCTSSRHWRHYSYLCITGGLLSLPWLVPSVLNPPLTYGTDVFVARAEEHVGTIGALLGLGGIWNEAAIPESRHTGFALFGVALFCILLTWMPRRESVLAALGLISCVFMTFGPVEWVTSHVPGTAMFRDSQKLIVLMLPALVAAASRIGVSHSPSETSKSTFLPALVISLTILQAPDAPLAMGALTPHTTVIPWRQLEGTTLNADSTGLVVYNDTVMVDPWAKATDTIAGGELRVDGETVDPASDAYNSARKAWENNDLDALTGLGISGVISHGEYHYLKPGNDSKSAHWWLGLSLTLIWITQCLFLAVQTLRKARRTTS